MLVQLSQFSHPLTSLLLVAAVHVKLVERALQTLVGENVKIHFATWCVGRVSYLLASTCFTQASQKLATASGLMRFAKYQETNGIYTHFEVVGRTLAVVASCLTKGHQESWTLDSGLCMLRIAVCTGLNAFRVSSTSLITCHDSSSVLVYSAS